MLCWSYVSFHKHRNHAALGGLPAVFLGHTALGELPVMFSARGNHKGSWRGDRRGKIQTGGRNRASLGGASGAVIHVPLQIGGWFSVHASCELDCTIGKHRRGLRRDDERLFRRACIFTREHDAGTAERGACQKDYANCRYFCHRSIPLRCSSVTPQPKKVLLRNQVLERDGWLSQALGS